MTITNKLIGTFIFLTLAFDSYGGIGLTDWSCQTPNGNEINNFDGVPSLYLKKGQMLERLDKWFFYNDNIIGQQKNGTYFIVNEKTSTITVFETEQQWTDFIKRNSYKPLIWTRWYDTDWKFFSNNLLFFAIIFFYVSIPLVILFVWIAFKAIRHEKLNRKKPFTLILAVSLGFIVVKFLLEQFPQSI